MTKRLPNRPQDSACQFARENGQPGIKLTAKPTVQRSIDQTLVPQFS